MVDGRGAAGAKPARARASGRNPAAVRSPPPKKGRRTGWSRERPEGEARGREAGPVTSPWSPRNQPMPSSNICWGIEIGAYAIKALKLELAGESPRIVDFAMVPHKK